MKRLLRFAPPAALVISMLAVSGAEARAQGSLQIPLQFDFLNPGARSLAVGSAFAGLADDATSAFTNPAGLTSLTLPEISFEVRGRRLESPFLRGGRLSGRATGIGVDTAAGAVYGESVADSIGLSYLSAVWPGTSWAMAAYRHEFVRLDQEFEADGVFQDAAFRELALRAQRRIAITSYGAAAAYRFNRRISVGGGVALHHFTLDAKFERFFFPDFYGEPTFARVTQLNNAEQRSDTLGVGVNVGALVTLYEAADPGAAGPDSIRLGVVYRHGPNFDFEAFEGAIANPVQRNGTFRSPNAFAVGTSIRLTQSATASAEMTLVHYESLAEGYVSSQAGGLGRQDNFRIDNGVEYHAGFEYVFTAWGFPALRVGAWRDPDHAVHYVVPANPDLFDERFGAYLPARGATMHYTFGGGIALGRQLEVNVGADLSKRTRQVSVSAVVRFPR